MTANRTRTFKSGNSVAVRLPKALGVEAGVEMRVREEHGRYVIEPVETGTGKIDLTGIWGACPGLKPISREDREVEERQLPWDLVGKRD